MVEANVQFYGALGSAEFGPRKYRQAKVYGRGVQRVEFVLEAKAVSRRDPLTVGQQFLEQRLVERVGLALINTGERCAGHLAATKVVELGRLGG